MTNLDRLRARARAAGEASLLRRALQPAPWLLAFAAVVAVLTLETRAPLAAAALGTAIVVLSWRRPVLGQAAWEGFVVGGPVAIAALLARGCAPTASEWACGIVCVAVGLVWATFVTPVAEASFRARAITASTAGLAAFIGCSSLGLGVGLAVAAATAAAWGVTASLRPVRG